MADVRLLGNTPNFDDIVRFAEEGVRAAVSGPPTELVAVKSHKGGFKMRVQIVGFRCELGPSSSAGPVGLYTE